MAETPSVAVGFIDNSNTEGLFTDSLAELCLANPQLQVIRLRSGANIAHARNMITRTFLETDKEWLLMVDADMQFPPDLLDKFFTLAHPGERPVLGALCFAYGHDGYYPTLYRQNDQEDYDRVENWQQYPNLLMPVDATGAACLLVHRDVFTTVGDNSEDKDRPWFAEERAPLSGRWRSEDLVFCNRVRSAGFPIYVMLNNHVGHLKKQVIDFNFYVNWVEHHRLLVTGTPRTGTTYVANLLNAVGVGAGHEVVYTPIEPRPWGLRRAEVSWMAVPSLPSFHGTILHLVRNPLAVLNSLMGIGFFQQPQGHIVWTEFLAHHGFHVDVDSPLETTQRFIMEWNRRIEPYAQRRMKVEDIGFDEFRWMLYKVDAYPPEHYIRRILAQHPTNQNTRTRADISWDACRPDFREFAREYGYDPR